MEKKFAYFDDVEKDPDYIKYFQKDHSFIDFFFNSSEENNNKIKVILDYFQENKTQISFFAFLFDTYLMRRIHKSEFLIQLLTSFFTQFPNEKDDFLSKLKKLGFLYNFLCFKGIIKHDPELDYKDEGLFENFKPGTMQFIIQNDLIEDLQKCVLMNENFDFNNKITIHRYFIASYMGVNNYLSYIEFATLVGSIKCFKYLYLNNALPENDDELNKICCYAIAGGNTEIIHILEQKGAHFNKECLNYSIFFHHDDLINWLLINYPIDEKEIVYYQLYHNAMHYKAFFYFINNCYDEYATDESMFIASYFCLLPTIKYLIEIKGVSPDARDELNQTPLFNLGYSIGCLPIAKYLVETAHADVNARDHYGHTPIMIACDHGNIEIVKYLCENGADLTLKDQEKFTPFIWACLKDHINIVKYFIEERHFNINENDFKTKLLDYVNEKRHTEIYKYLLTCSVSK